METKKWEKQQYLDVLQDKKWEAHNKQWLYIEVNAKDLLEECEPGMKIRMFAVRQCWKAC